MKFTTVAEKERRMVESVRRKNTRKTNKRTKIIEMYDLIGTGNYVCLKRRAQDRNQWRK